MLPKWKALIAVFIVTLICGLMLVAAIKEIPVLKGRIGDGAVIALVVGTTISFLVISVKISFFRGNFFLQILTSVALAVVLTAMWFFAIFLLVLVIFRPSGIL
jgi:hypothetical protein